MTETTNSKPRTRVMWSAAERAEWRSLFEQSGQTAAEFCRHNDLSPATLSFWLRQQQEPAVSEESALVEIPQQILASVGGTAVTAHLPGGVRLQIAAGTDPAWLAQLVQALAIPRA